MTGPIFVFNPTGDLVPICEQPYETEDVFQELLAKYPQLLLGGDERTPYSRLLLIAREQGVPIEEGGGDYFALDHLFVDQDGVPTLVEVKRRSDGRKRREFVAQMLDYAANGLAFWTVDDIRRNFQATCHADTKDPDTVLAEFLGEQGIAEEFWNEVEENIKAERIRMVLVGDDIPAELCRIVSFLNRQMETAEMLAIELKQFVGEGICAFVPDVVVQPEPLPPPPSSTWTEARFMAELERQAGLELVPVARTLLEWGVSRTTRIQWGKGRYDGSFTPILVVDGENYNSISVWTYGAVSIQFGYLMNEPPFDTVKKRKELLGRLNAIPGIALQQNALEKFPSIPLQAFLDEGAQREFLSILDWVIFEMQSVAHAWEQRL